MTAPHGSGKSRYDVHRFDNHSGWVDIEGRREATKKGLPLGHGFAEQRPPPKEVRQERPFYVLEPAFTSGLMVQRKYDQLECGYKTETTRADPYHFPNHLEVKDEHHFNDWRRKSQNVDPRQWQPDPSLKRVITDQMVKQHCAAKRGEGKGAADPKDIAEFFRSDPPSEVGSARSGTVANPEKPARKDWAWCMGGRKAHHIQEQQEAASATLSLMRSQSSPQMTTLTGPSLMEGNMGGESSTGFHGLDKRKFGVGHADARMRGGKPARDGWAGSFPDKELRAFASNNVKRM